MGPPSLSSAALPTPPPRRSVSPRTSPSLRSSARTRLRTSASTLPSSSMPPTPFDQKEIIIGESSCEQITLTLDTQACRQQHHKVVAHAVPVVHHATHHAVHHAAPVHHAPVYRGK